MTEQNIQFDHKESKNIHFPSHDNYATSSILIANHTNMNNWQAFEYLRNYCNQS